MGGDGIRCCSYFESTQSCIRSRHKTGLAPTMPVQARTQLRFSASQLQDLAVFEVVCLNFFHGTSSSNLSLNTASGKGKYS